MCIYGLLWWLRDKESGCQCRRYRFDSWSRRSPGEGNGNLLQYSCLEKSQEQRSLAGYSPWGYKESDMTEQLNNYNVYIRVMCVCVCVSERGRERLRATPAWHGQSRLLTTEGSPSHKCIPPPPGEIQVCGAWEPQEWGSPHRYLVHFKPEQDRTCYFWPA